MRVPDEHTKIIARLHPQANGRGLTVYNTYFEQKGINATYLLFRSQDLDRLISGLRSLGLAGAIPAGFEGDPRLPSLVDNLTPVAARVGRVSAIVNRDGVLTGHYSAGGGLAEAIKEATPVRGSQMTIMGAGNVARGLLAYLDSIEEYPASVSVYNRTVEGAQAVADTFKVDRVGSLDDMLATAQSGIFVNATDVGSPWNKGREFVFSAAFLSQFAVVADCTFVPLVPQLIAAAQAAGVASVPGWSMFVHQGMESFRMILGIDIDGGLLGELCRRDFETNWS